jgi:hypothetical protein
LRMVLTSSAVVIGFPLFCHFGFRWAVGPLLLIDARKYGAVLTFLIAPYLPTKKPAAAARSLDGRCADPGDFRGGLRI